MRACKAELTYDPGQIASTGPDFVVAEMNLVIAGFYALQPVNGQLGAVAAGGRVVMDHTGGCLCGAIRFRAEEEPVAVGYCHCKMCQKVSGAAVLPWASFLIDSFDYTTGTPKIYRSSPHGQREFCTECGSQLAFRSADLPGTIEINVGVLDDTSKVTPQYHIWCTSRITWFETTDGLPRFPESGPAG